MTWVMRDESDAASGANVPGSVGFGALAGDEALGDLDLGAHPTDSSQAVIAGGDRAKIRTLKCASLRPRVLACRDILWRRSEGTAPNHHASQAHVKDANDGSTGHSQILAHRLHAVAAA